MHLSQVDPSYYGKAIIRRQHCNRYCQIQLVSHFYIFSTSSIHAFAKQSNLNAFSVNPSNSKHVYLMAVQKQITGVATYVVHKQKKYPWIAWILKESSPFIKFLQ